jgi:hypothetical protein
MARTPRVRWAALALALAVLCQATPARAAVPTKYLPDDSEIVFTVNVRGFLDAPLVKKNLLDMAKEFLKNQKFQKELAAVGFDPLKDLDGMTYAVPDAADPHKGLTIITGKFDTEKIQQKAAEFAKKNDKVLKISKTGNYQLWELTPPNEDKTIYIVLVDKTTLLASTGKEQVTDALAKADGKKKTELKKKTLANLLKKTDKKQTFCFFALGTALAKIEIPNVGEQAKAVLDEIKSLSGAVTVGADIKVRINVGTKTAAKAKQLSKKVNQGLLVAQTFLALQSDERLAPVADLLKTVKARAKESTVTVTFTITKELILEGLKFLKQMKANRGDD